MKRTILTLISISALALTGLLSLDKFFASGGSKLAGVGGDFAGNRRIRDALQRLSARKPVAAPKQGQHRQNACPPAHRSCLFPLRDGSCLQGRATQNQRGKALFTQTFLSLHLR